ncbi:MAG: hypothetical protein ABIS50_14760 [Luteolibacter sp.]|uniref:hypothetical protein n=1 Tax=Luteolibacter sp. TaxID=1962973 RepID=UPI0032636B17
MSPESRYQHTTGTSENLVTGGLAGLAAALVGAGTWAAVTYFTNYQIGFMAIGVGYLVGVTMRKYGNGQSNAFGVLAAVLAVLGCVLGNLLSACAFGADSLHVPLMAVLGKMTPSVALSVLQDGFSPIDALFYFLAVSAAYRNSRAVE